MVKTPLFKVFATYPAIVAIVAIACVHALAGCDPEPIAVTVETQNG